MSRFLYRIAYLVLPPAWREAMELVRKFGIVRAVEIVSVGSLYLLRTLSEVFGIFMIWPILQFIEADGDLSVLAAGSRLWRILASLFEAVDVPINLYTMSAVVMVLITLRQVIAFAAIVRTEHLKELAGQRLRTRLFGMVLTSRADYVQSFRTGHFVTLINQHCQSSGSAIRNFLGLLGIYITIGTYGAAALAMAPAATAICAVFGVIMIRLMRRYADTARQIGKETVVAHQDFSHFLTERYRAWRLLKIAQTEAVEVERADKWAEHLASLYVRRTAVAARIQLYVTPFAGAFALGGLILSYSVLGLALAEITLFVIVLFRLLPVMEQFLGNRQAFAQIYASLRRVDDVLNETRAAREPDGGDVAFSGLTSGIEFDSVVFHYNKGQAAALNGATARIPAGKLTAITGPSGAGKSTLVDMIPRIIVAEDGAVQLDGTPVEAFTLDSLRRGIAFVAQQPLLFDASVADNVRYTRPEATDEEIAEACRLAHAAEFVEALPQGFDTKLGEAGARLSGGQRQRLALAQAFLKRASILILDEPTSALDYESERSIQLALPELRRTQDVTIIVIAHRLSTIRGADHLIVLRDGVVIEQGAPGDLGRSDSWFARMLEQGGQSSHERTPAA